MNRTRTLLLLGFLATDLCGCSTHIEKDESVVSSDRMPSEWDSIPSVQHGPYTIYEKTRKMRGGVEKSLYVAGKRLREPKLIYTHHRAVSMKLGNTQKHILINDACASKEHKVFVVEIASGIKHDVGQAVLDRYRKEFSPAEGLWIVPIGKGFSEDDAAVLVEVELIYIDGHSGDKADQLAKAFQKRWYMIDHETLKIVSVHEKAVQL